MEKSLPRKREKLLGVAAAIVNTVYHATGKRIRHLPMAFNKLL